MTKAKPIPEGYHTVTPYFVVPDGEAFLSFIERAFAATITYRSRDNSHAEARIGDSMIMVGQAKGDWQPQQVSTYLYVEDCDAWYKRAVEGGATSTMEPADQFYGDRNGGVKDPWGNNWWIGTHKEDLSPEEIEKRALAAGR